MGIGSALIGGMAGGAAVNIVINAVDNFSKTFKAANIGMLALGGAITAIGVAGAGAIVGVTKLAGNLEQATIAFTTMLGSATKADKLLRDLSDFASKTPFTIPGIRQNAKMLLAMGVELDDMLPTLKSLGDVSAGLSVPLDRLALNFGQVKVQGKLTGRELRDFAVAGVPLIAELAKNLNKAEAEIKEMVSAGKIGFADVENAFKTMSGEGGKFYNLMEEQNKSLFGQISNIQDNFIKLGETMGQYFLPVAKFVAESIVTITNAFAEHPKLAEFAAVLLGVFTVLSLIVGPLIILVALLPFLIAGFGALSLSMFPIIGTVALIALGIAALIAVFVWWDEIIVWFTKVFIKAAGIWDKIWQGFKDMFIIGWAYIKNAAVMGWNFLVDLYQKGVQKVFDFLRPMLEMINEGSRRLGFGDIFNLGDTQKSIDALSGFKGQLEDIDALKAKLANERATRAIQFEAAGNALYEQIKTQRLGTEEAEKQLEISSKETEELKKQTELVSKLQGMKVLTSGNSQTGVSFGDIYNPNSFSKGDFESDFAYNQAKLGGGIKINIENINGMDPDEVARALNEKLSEVIST